MPFDPNSFTPSYSATAKETKAAPVAIEAKKGFDPSSFVPVAPSDATVQQNFWNKFKSGLMDAVDTYNYQVGSGVRGMVQLVTPRDSKAGQALANIQKREQEAAQKARKSSPYAAFAGDVAGIGTDIASKLSMGGGIAAGARALVPEVGAAINAGIAASPRVGAIVQSAAQSGAYGATQYAEDAKDRLQNAAIGAAIGGASTGVVQGAKAVIGKMFNRPLPEAKELVEKAEGTLGQVLNRESIQKGEQLLTKVPVIGTKGHLIKQRDALEKLTKDFATKVGEAPVSPLATKAPEGIAQSAQYHIQKTASNLADKTSALYNKFEQAAGKVTDKLPLTNTQQQAKRLLESQSGIFKLPGGEDVKQVAETLANAKAIHPGMLQQANKFLSTAYEKTEKVSATAARDILQVKNALNKDMAVFAESQGGEVARLYNKASRFASEAQMPFKNNVLVDKVLKGNIEPEKIMKQIVKPDQPEFLKQILKPMTPEGRGALRNGILTTLHEKASISGEFNPITYSKDLDKVMKTMKGALNKEQYKELQGIQKLFKSTSANQQYAQQEGLFPGYIAASAAASGMMTNAPLTTGVLGTIQGISALLTSPKLSKWLIKMADTSSPKVQESIRDVITKSLVKKTTVNTVTNSPRSPENRAVPIDYNLRID